jgi:hypothetical protein
MSIYPMKNAKLKSHSKNIFDHIPYNKDFEQILKRIEENDRKDANSCGSIVSRGQCYKTFLSIIYVFL